MLKVVGICILLFTIFRLSKAICKKELLKVRLLSELSRFMHEMRLALSVSMKSLGEFSREFKTDEPYLTELLGSEFRLLESEDGAAAFRENIGECGAEIFQSFIFGFGRGYLESEIKRLDVIIGSFDAHLTEQKDIISRRLRVCRTLGISSSFALLILFI